MSPQSLIEGIETPHSLSLRFADVPIRVKTNDPEVWTRLASYFAAYVVGGAPPLAEVRLIQGSVPIPGEFADLAREGGRRPKEATREVAGGRLILKRATGVLMGLWPGGAFAAGDIRANLNQGINLVNNCYAKVVLRRGHVLLHASAVSRDGRTAVLAGPPGAGKSTSALHLVEAGFHCLSNDRVLAKPMPRHGGGARLSQAASRQPGHAPRPSAVVVAARAEPIAPRSPRCRRVSCGSSSESRTSTSTASTAPAPSTCGVAWKPWCS